MHLQVWNRNSFTGLLGIFNVQGSSWSRQKRKFHTHNAHPPTLNGHIRPADIPGLSSLVAAGSHQHSSQASPTAHKHFFSVSLHRLSKWARLLEGTLYLHDSSASLAAA